MILEATFKAAYLDLKTAGMFAVRVLDDGAKSPTQIRDELTNRAQMRVRERNTKRGQKEMIFLLEMVGGVNPA